MTASRHPVQNIEKKRLPIRAVHIWHGGSGKTALMAGRVALLLAAGIPTREIVAITFTEAAASELRERIEGFVNRLARADIPDELRVALPDGLSAEQSGRSLRPTKRLMS